MLRVITTVLQSWECHMLPGKMMERKEDERQEFMCDHYYAITPKMFQSFLQVT